MNIPFHESELETVEVRNIPGGGSIEVFHTPVSEREGVKSLFRHEPIWQISGMGLEYCSFCPSVNPDNIARALIIDATSRRDRQGQAGGKDMFGIEWEFVPEVGGSMVRPGNPFAEDANELLEKIVWPDLDSWDWEGSAKVNASFFKKDRFYTCWLMNGWFERLISMLEFEGAALALVDPDQKDAVKEFFDHLSDFYIELLGRYMHYFPEIDGFYIHDDWGGQKDTFFSPAVAEEMIVPYMRRVTDFLHSKGKVCDLHSCGHNIKQVENYIKAGWDAWQPQPMNDADAIYRLYGDRILISIPPAPMDVQNASEEELKAAARAYAEKYCHPDKPSLLSLHGREVPTAYRRELYRVSRLRYSAR